MLGYYNYTVILTYLSVASSLFGMMLINSQYGMRFAIFCLMFSGFCDMFDGKVARTMKDRSSRQKAFGIQIDSLADVICFGAFPALINYKLSVTHIINSGLTFSRIFAFITSLLFLLSAIIRLGYFNVLEAERQVETTEARKYYQGLPVTSIAIILPTIYLLKYLLGISEPCGILFNFTLLIVSFLYVTNFKVKKPTTRDLIIICIFGFVILLAIFQLNIFKR